MPTLGALTASILLPPTDAKLPEYKRVYRDSSVSCFIPVPNIPILHSAPSFEIEVTSDTWIAPGLSVFVFVDGVYQCNRNRRTPPTDSESEPRMAIRLRQKEEKYGTGSGPQPAGATADFVARNWKWVELDIPNADKATPASEDQQNRVGKIEVVVLRCDLPAEVPPAPDRTASAPKASGKPPVAKDPSAKAPPAKEPPTKAPSARAPPAKAPSAKNEASTDGFFHLFDGAGDFDLRDTGNAHSMDDQPNNYTGKEWDVTEGRCIIPNPDLAAPDTIGCPTLPQQIELHPSSLAFDGPGDAYDFPGVVINQYGHAQGPYQEQQSAPFLQGQPQMMHALPPRPPTVGQSLQPGVHLVPQSQEYASAPAQAQAPGPPAMYDDNEQGNHYAVPQSGGPAYWNPQGLPLGGPKVYTAPTHSYPTYVQQARGVSAGNLPQSRSGPPVRMTRADYMRQNHWEPRITDFARQREALYARRKMIVHELGVHYKFVSDTVPYTLLRYVPLSRLSHEEWMTLDAQLGIMLEQGHTPDGEPITSFLDLNESGSYRLADLGLEDTDADEDLVERTRDMIFYNSHNSTLIFGHDYRIVAACVPFTILKYVDTFRLSGWAKNQLDWQLRKLIGKGRLPTGELLRPMDDPYVLQMRRNLPPPPKERYERKHYTSSDVRRIIDNDREKARKHESAGVQHLGDDVYQGMYRGHKHMDAAEGRFKRLVNNWNDPDLKQDWAVGLKKMLTKMDREDQRPAKDRDDAGGQNPWRTYGRGNTGKKPAKDHNEERVSPWWGSGHDDEQRKSSEQFRHYDTESGSKAGNRKSKADDRRNSLSGGGWGNYGGGAAGDQSGGWNDAKVQGEPQRAEYGGQQDDRQSKRSSQKSRNKSAWNNNADDNQATQAWVQNVEQDDNAPAWPAAEGANDATGDTWGGDQPNEPWGGGQPNETWGGDQANNTWGNDAQKTPSAGKAPAKHSSSRRSEPSKTSTKARSTADPDADIQPYFATWRNAPDSSSSGLHHHQPREPFAYPAPPAPRVTPSHLGSRSHGVQAGKGAEYSHRTMRPEYLDTMEKPFATFVFRYRSADKLSDITGKDVNGDLAWIAGEVGRGVFMGMSKDQLVEQLLKASEKAPKEESQKASASGSKKEKSEKNASGDDAGWGEQSQKGGGKGKAAAGGGWNDAAPTFGGDGGANAAVNW